MTKYFYEVSDPLLYGCSGWEDDFWDTCGTVLFKYPRDAKKYCKLYNDPNRGGYFYGGFKTVPDCSYRKVRRNDPFIKGHKVWKSYKDYNTAVD